MVYLYAKMLSNQLLPASCFHTDTRINLVHSSITFNHFSPSLQATSVVLCVCVCVCVFVCPEGSLTFNSSQRNQQVLGRISDTVTESHCELRKLCVCVCVCV